MKSVLLKLVFFGGDGDPLSGSGTFLLDRRTNDEKEEDSRELLPELPLLGRSVEVDHGSQLLHHLLLLIRLNPFRHKCGLQRTITNNGSIFKTILKYWILMTKLKSSPVETQGLPPG